MPKTERDLLGPGFELRLRNALDRIQPRYSTPRYQQARSVRAWRLAPVALAAAVTGVAVLTLYAAAGGSSPTEIGHRIVTAIQPEQDQPSPTPQNNPEPPSNPRAAPAPPPSHVGSSNAQPTHQAEPSEKPEPGGSPQPQAGPTPAPTPSEDHGSWPSPSPGPGDH